MSLGREDQSSRQSPHIACHTGNRSIYRRQGAGDK
jgi:hypothetical protein